MKRMMMTTTTKMKTNQLSVTGAVSRGRSFELGRCPFLGCHRCCVFCGDQEGGGDGRYWPR